MFNKTKNSLLIFIIALFLCSCTVENSQSTNTEKSDKKDSVEDKNNVQVHTSDKYDISFKELTDSGIVFHVENKSDSSIKLTPSSIALDNQNVINAMLNEVKINSNDSKDYKLEVKLNSLKHQVLSGSFKIVNGGDSSDYTNIDFSNIKIGEESILEDEVLDVTQNNMLSNDILDIAFIEYDNRNLKMSVHNKEDKSIDIIIDVVYINHKYLANFTCGGIGVAPESTGRLTIFPGNDIGAVNYLEISGTVFVGTETYHPLKVGYNVL